MDFTAFDSGQAYYARTFFIGVQEGFAVFDFGFIVSVIPRMNWRSVLSLGENIPFWASHFVHGIPGGSETPGACRANYKVKLIQFTL